RHRRVRGVLLVEIDGLDTETLQRSFDGRADVGATTLRADALERAVVAGVAELGRDDGLLANTGQRRAEARLAQAVVGAVDVGRVEECDAGVEGRSHHGVRARLVEGECAAAT